MEIKILGTGCAGCKALYAAAAEAVAEIGTAAKLEKVEDMAEIISFGVMRLPAVVIDGKVVSQGKKLSKDELKELIK